jgi:hypothetical protein
MKASGEKAMVRGKKSIAGFRDQRPVKIVRIPITDP